MVWAPVVVGLLLLGFGKKLYWVFVGATGFAIGLAVATRVTQKEPDLVSLAVALLFGLAGAVLVYFVQRVAIALAGFLGGGWLAAGLWQQAVAPSPEFPWIPALVGGILGAALAATLFGWVLIVLSSILGAVLVAQYLNVSHGAQGAVIAVLAILGVLVQGGALRHAQAQAGEGPPAKR